MDDEEGQSRSGSEGEEMEWDVEGGEGDRPMINVDMRQLMRLRLLLGQPPIFGEAHGPRTNEDVRARA